MRMRDRTRCDEGSVVAVTPSWCDGREVFRANPAEEQA